MVRGWCDSYHSLLLHPLVSDVILSTGCNYLILTGVILARGCNYLILAGVILATGCDYLILADVILSTGCNYFLAANVIVSRVSVITIQVHTALLTLQGSHVTIFHIRKMKKRQKSVPVQIMATC